MIALKYMKGLVVVTVDVIKKRRQIISAKSSRIQTEKQRHIHAVKIIKYTISIMPVGCDLVEMPQTNGCPIQCTTR